MLRVFSTPASYRFPVVAVCAAFGLTACGGGGGGGDGVAGNATVGTGTSRAASSVEAAAADAASMAGNGNGNGNGNGMGPPMTPPGLSKRPVKTPTDIGKERDREKDSPAPVDRGNGPAGGPKTTQSVLSAPTANAGTTGQWAAPTSWPINAIHAVLMPDGKVLSYGTNPLGEQGAQLYYDVWTPSTNAHSLLQHTTRTDMFCSAQSVLPGSGQVLIVGGDTRGVTPDKVNWGVPDVNLFDPFAMTMAAAPKMTYARWYGSSVPLANGSVLVLGGAGDGMGSNAEVPEIYTPGLNGGWRELRAIAWPGDLFYPRAILAPNGRVIVPSDNRLFSINTELPNLAQIATLPKTVNWTLPWVLYDRGKMLMLADDGGAMTVDVNGATPVVTTVAPAGTNRIWGTTVVLPDGKVLLTGGSAIENQLSDTAFSANLWDPKTGSWTVGESAQKPRLYHSTALLLPDGTVLSAGGGSPGPVVNLNAEIYSPPYLFDANGSRTARPLINAAPTELNLGANFSFSVASTRPIRRVTLVRTGSVTHSTNFEQRFLELPFTQTSGSPTVNVVFNESPNVLPIGHYMLFAIDDAGVPSIGKIVKLGGGWTKVVDQGGSFTAPAGTLVQYGYGADAVEKTVSGAVSCGSAFFGSEPAVGVFKACHVLTPKASSVTGVVAAPSLPAPPVPGAVLAAEGATFVLPTPTRVKFGDGTRWLETTLVGPVTCRLGVFGTVDPAPGVAKSCVVGGTVVAPPAPPPVVPPAVGTVLASEGGNFTVATSTLVRFGAGTRWTEKTVVGAASCTNTFFGGNDPAPGVLKSCIVGTATTTTPPPTTPPPTTTTPTAGTVLAVEGVTFAVTGTTVVRYGADTRWTEKTVTGTATCTNAYFGGNDPAPGVVRVSPSSGVRKGCIKVSIG